MLERVLRVLSNPLTWWVIGWSILCALGPMLARALWRRLALIRSEYSRGGSERSVPFDSCTWPELGPQEEIEGAIVYRSPVSGEPLHVVLNDERQLLVLDRFTPDGLVAAHVEARTPERRARPSGAHSSSARTLPATTLASGGPPTHTATVEVPSRSACRRGST
jgi:hypothetical protein